MNRFGSSLILGLVLGSAVGTSVQAAKKDVPPPQVWPEVRMCVADAGQTVLYRSRDGVLRAWPSQEQLGIDASGEITAMACGDASAAIGMRDARDPLRGRVLILARDVDRWSAAGEIAVRGVPRLLALGGKRLGVVLETKSGLAFGTTEAEAGAKLETVPIDVRATAMVVSPDRQTFLLAAGHELRSYALSDGRTRHVFAFAEEIGAIASAPGNGRILVGQGRSVVTVDPNDKPDKGVLPERARTELARPPRALAWESNEAAIALLEEPAVVVILGAEDLAHAEEHSVGGAADVAAIGPLAGLWIGSEADQPQRFAWKPVPPPPPAPKPEEVEPIPAASAAGAEAKPAPSAADAEVKPATGAAVVAGAAAGAATTGAPVTNRPVEPAATGQPPTGRGSLEPPPEMAMPPKSAPSKPPAQTTSPPASTTPPTATAQTPPPATPPVQAPPPASPAPAASAPPTSTAPESPPTPSTPPPAPPPVQAAPPPSATPSAPTTQGTTAPPSSAAAPSALPPAEQAVPSDPASGNADANARTAVAAGGTIEGQIEGAAALVSEIVISGPDSGIRTFARVKVTISGEIGRFSVTGVPPGSYFVQPMGPAGGSVLASPSMRRIVVGAGAGARADFTILGSR